MCSCKLEEEVRLVLTDFPYKETKKISRRDADLTLSQKK